MLPMKALRLELGSLLAADATYLAPPALQNFMVLIKAPFALSESLLVTDLTLADFTGSARIGVVLGAQEIGVDPATQEQIITIKPPAGGWRWAVTGLTNIPQTIWGFALLDNGLANVLGAELLPVPQALHAIGEVIDLGKVSMTFVLQPLS